MGSSFPCGNGAYLVLLRVGFTQLPQSLGAPVSSYLAFSPLPWGMGVAAIPQGGMVSVALSLFPVCRTGNSPRYGPPCPVELGLSSPPDFLLRTTSERATICFPPTPSFPKNFSKSEEIFDDTDQERLS